MEDSAAKGPFSQQQVAQVYERAPVVLCATSLNSLIVVIVLWGVTASVNLLLWLVGVSLLSITRYAFYHRFHRLTPTPEEAGLWSRRFLVGATISGLLWGSSAVVLFPISSPVHQLFLIFVVGGLVAGAAGAYAVFMPAFFGFSAPALVPFMVRFLTGGEFVGIATGGMLFLFGTFMVWTAAKNHRTVMSAMQRQFENTDLVASLVAEKRHGEKLNEELAAEIVERERAEQELLQHRDHLEELVERRARLLRDVNERLEAEIAERTQSEERITRVAREWTATFDTMKDFIAITDLDFRFVRVNKALAELLATSPRELIGKPCYESMHGHQEPWPECPHRVAIHEDRTVTREIDDPHLGFPLLMTCSPFHDESGAVVGTVHTARDISSQKRAEQTRERLIAELQQAMASVKMLSGLLPICSSCKKIRDDKGYWKQIESYIRDHSEAEFSHGICPDCLKELYPEFAEEEDETEK